MPDLNVALAVFFVIIMSSIIRGLTGFGLAMISMPLVSFFLPYRETVVLVVVINLAFSIVHLLRSRGLIKSKYFILIFIFFLYRCYSRSIAVYTELTMIFSRLLRGLLL